MSAVTCQVPPHITLRKLPNYPCSIWQYTPLGLSLAVVPFPLNIAVHTPTANQQIPTRKVTRPAIQPNPNIPHPCVYIRVWIYQFSQGTIAKDFDRSPSIDQTQVHIFALVFFNFTRWRLLSFSRCDAWFYSPFMFLKVAACNWVCYLFWDFCIAVNIFTYYCCLQCGFWIILTLPQKKKCGFWILIMWKDNCG